VQDFTASELLACAARRWSPQIGDPDLAGWVVTLAYLGAALLAFLVWRRAAVGRRERLFWLVILGLMLFLGLNKQLDLQSALTATGRCIAKFQGWYAERRAFQRHFIEAVFAGALAVMLLGLWIMRRHLRRNIAAMIGLAILAVFIADRAGGFTHLDAMVGQKALSPTGNFLFEISGLLLIMLNAAVLLARARPGHSP
jgi:hypothetical protein